MLQLHDLEATHGNQVTLRTLDDERQITKNEKKIATKHYTFVYHYDDRFIDFEVEEVKSWQLFMNPDRNVSEDAVWLQGTEVLSIPIVRTPKLLLRSLWHGELGWRLLMSLTSMAGAIFGFLYSIMPWKRHTSAREHIVKSRKHSYPGSKYPNDPDQQLAHDVEEFFAYEITAATQKVDGRDLADLRDAFAEHDIVLDEFVPRLQYFLQTRLGQFGRNAALWYSKGAGGTTGAYGSLRLCVHSFSESLLLTLN